MTGISDKREDYSRAQVQQRQTHDPLLTSEQWFPTWGQNCVCVLRPWCGTKCFSASKTVFINMNIAVDFCVCTLYDQICAYAHSMIKSVRTHTLRSNPCVRTLYDQIWAYAHPTIKSERTHTLRSNPCVRTLYDQIWAYAHSTIKSERTHTLRSNPCVRTLYDQICAYAHSTIKSVRTHVL